MHVTRKKLRAPHGVTYTLLLSVLGWGALTVILLSSTGCATRPVSSQGVQPKGGSFVVCPVDPELRTRLVRPALPADDRTSEQLYTGRIKDTLDTSEGRTSSAVKAIDACNAVNTEVQKQLAPPRPWWMFWSRG